MTHGTWIKKYVKNFLMKEIRYSIKVIKLTVKGLIKKKKSYFT